VVNKANPYGDFLNGFAGQLTFTNTIDRVITRIRCSIHEADGSLARTDQNSAVIFKIDQQVPADLNLVDTLLQSKLKSDQQIAEEAEDPQSGLENFKYTKDIFQ
jgi:ribosomal protein L14